MRAPVAAGARCLMLDPSVAQATLPASLLGLPLNWRAGSAERGVADPGVSSFTMTLRGRGRRPLSPARLIGRRSETGDWRLSWIRRSRIGGDSWDEVPLGEEREAYRLEILDGAGGTVLDARVPLTPRPEGPRRRASFRVGGRPSGRRARRRGAGARSRR